MCHAAPFKMGPRSCEKSKTDEQVFLIHSRGHSGRFEGEARVITVKF